MQIEMHAVDAEIARPHPAHDGIEIGAVAVKKAPALMHGRRSRDISSSNRPQVLGLVSMNAATSSSEPYLLKAARSTRPRSFAGIGSTE